MDESSEQHAPGEPRPTGGFRPILFLLLYFLAVGTAFLLVSVPLLVILVAAGLLDEQSPELMLNLPAMTITWIPVAIVILLVTVAFVRFVDRRPVRTLGLAREGSWKTELGLGMVLGIGLPLLMFAVSYAAGWTTITGSLFTEPVDRVTAVTIQALLLMAAVSIGEETLIRGYVLQTLRWGYGAIAALIVSSLVFGVAHMANPGAAFPGFLGTAAAGIVLGYGYLITGRLWLPIAFHFGWNFALGPILGFPVSGVEINAWINQSVDGPIVWTGGDFGPEAGLLGVVVLLIGVGIITRFGRDLERAPAPYPGSLVLRSHE